MRSAMITIELEKEAQVRKKNSQANASHFFRESGALWERMKNAAEIVARSGLRPQINMKPMLEANKTPVEDR